MTNISASVNLGVASVSITPNLNQPSGLDVTVCVGNPVSVCYTPPAPDADIKVTTTIIGSGFISN